MIHPNNSVWRVQFIHLREQINEKKKDGEMYISEELCQRRSSHSQTPEIEHIPLGQIQNFSDGMWELPSRLRNELCYKVRITTFQKLDLFPSSGEKWNHLVQ
jgi:hypothetical protein